MAKPLCGTTRAAYLLIRSRGARHLNRALMPVNSFVALTRPRCTCLYPRNFVAVRFPRCHPDQPGRSRPRIHSLWRWEFLHCPGPIPLACLESTMLIASVSEEKYVALSDVL